MLALITIRRRLLWGLLALGLALLLAAPALAQGEGYTVGRSAPGGGRAAGVGYALAGTLGQPAVTAQGGDDDSPRSDSWDSVDSAADGWRPALSIGVR